MILDQLLSRLQAHRDVYGGKIEVRTMSENWAHEIIRVDLVDVDDEGNPSGWVKDQGPLHHAIVINCL